MLDAMLISALIVLVTALMTAHACTFSVESDQEDRQLLAKQLVYAKEKLMDTSWKLDTPVIYSKYDSNKDSQLEKGELHAILLLSRMNSTEADGISSSLLVLGDLNADNKLSISEFNSLFGIKKPSDPHKSSFYSKLVGD